MDEELKDLLAKAQARYEAMTPDQKAEMWREQRRSYVRGELMMDDLGLTYEEADRRVRAAEAGIVLLTDTADSATGKGQDTQTRSAHER